MVDVLRKGVSHGPSHVDVHKMLPTLPEPASDENFKKNIFCASCQLRYRNDEAQRSPALVIACR